MSKATSKSTVTFKHLKSRFTKSKDIPRMLSVYLGCICFNWGTAFCTTVESKMDEGLRIGKSHLVENKKSAGQSLTGLS